MAGAAVAVVLIAVAVFGRLYWPLGGMAGDRAPKDPASALEDEDAFVGPAFSPNASDEDLQRAAEAEVAALVRRFPESVAALHVLARLHFGLGRRAEAMAVWERCVEQAPQHAEALLGLSQAAFGREDYVAAEKWSRKWLALNPRDTQAQAMLAEVLWKLQQLDELVVVFEPIFLRGELSPEAGVSLGLTYLQSQRLPQAERTFQAVLAATLANQKLQKRAHYALAALYAQQDRPVEARRHREEFQVLSESDLSATRERVRTQGDGVSRRIAVEAHNECARVYLDHGDLATAEVLWRKAAALGSQDVESRTQLAGLYERTNREALALRRCEELRRLQPDNPDHWLNVGLLRARLQQFDAAREALAKAVELDPQESRYRRAYELIRNQP